MKLAFAVGPGEQGAYGKVRTAAFFFLFSISNRKHTGLARRAGGGHGGRRRVSSVSCAMGFAGWVRFSIHNWTLAPTFIYFRNAPLLLGQRYTTFFSVGLLDGKVNLKHGLHQYI